MTGHEAAESGPIEPGQLSGLGLGLGYDGPSADDRPSLGEFDDYSPYPPIADYGFLSDCHTGALVAPDGHAWDMILLVSYPSRQAFSAMVADPDYQQITGLRTAALSEAVLQATVPSTG